MFDSHHPYKERRISCAVSTEVSALGFEPEDLRSNRRRRTTANLAVYRCYTGSIIKLMEQLLQTSLKW